MIRYYRNKDIDRTRWDQCIRQSVNGLIYGNSWYLDEVCEDWDGLVIDNYEAVFPIPFKKRLGIRYSLHPLFCQQLGLFSTQPGHLKELSSILEQIPVRFRIMRAYLNYMNPLPGESRMNLVLDLILPYKQLQAKYKDNCQRNLETALKSGCSLLSGISTPDFIKLYKETTGLKDPLKPADYQRFTSLINTLVSKGAAELVGVYSAMNHLCAAGIFMNDGRRIYYISGCSDPVGRKSCASFMIIDYIISKYAGRNYILDFEGSEIKGVASFFMGFGAQESRYYVFSRNSLPGILKNLIPENFPN